MPWDPFSLLASTAAQIVTDAWTAAWLSVWNGGLWVLRLVLSWMDAWLTPDLSADGPAQDLYQVTFWIAGVMVLAMFMVQLGIAVGRHDGKGLARAGIGMGQFLVVTGGWIAYTVAITTAAGGLTRAVMDQVMNVTSWNSWEPWTTFDVKQVTDAGLATVLGLMGLLMWIAAIGHLLVILARDAALMVLVGTGPITAAGLVNEGTRAWFWKAFRWFHVAAFTPLLVVIVTGVGMKFATGAAAGKSGSMEASIGTALPAIVLICISVVCPVALFKLLAFVDPGTASGASMRAGMAAFGGVQGLLRGNTAGGAPEGNAARPTPASAPPPPPASRPSRRSGRPSPRPSPPGVTSRATSHRPPPASPSSRAGEVMRVRRAFDPTAVGWRIGKAHEPSGRYLWCPWDRTAHSGDMATDRCLVLPPDRLLSGTRVALCHTSVEGVLGDRSHRRDPAEPGEAEDLFGFGRAGHAFHAAGPPAAQAPPDDGEHHGGQHNLEGDDPAVHRARTGKPVAPGESGGGITGAEPPSSAPRPRWTPASPLKRRQRPADR